MPEAASVAHALVAAEERLRALGHTGGQAFDVLMDGLEARRAGALDRLPDALLDALAPLPTDGGLDLAGLAYERFFPDLFKGRHGQYFTPPGIGRLLVSRLDIQAGETVLDPACGVGGLLRHAEARGARVRGIERDPRLARLASFGLGANVRCADMFTTPPEPVDVVVANPPFSVPVRDPEVLAAHRWPEATALSDQLFAALLVRWVRPGGRAGVVMPASLLSNRTFAATRAVLDEGFVRQAICLLPEGVFRPFGGAAGRAVLVWLTRRGDESPTETPTRWAQLDNPGYDPRSLQLKPTSDQELEALCRGEGFSELSPGMWMPVGQPLDGVPLRALAEIRTEQGPSTGPVQRLDLGDVDPSTGEARPRPDHDLRSRRRLHADDVLVARLRPERGNVTVVPTCSEPVVGSPEWVVLRVSRAPRWVWLVARTPAWRAQLPIAAGQTRPRTTAEAILDARIPWAEPGPSDRAQPSLFPPHSVVDRVDALAERLLSERARLAEQLRALQDAVETYVEARDVEALERAVDAIEER